MTTRVQTYHCMCTNLILATTYPLSRHRKLDRSLILPIPSISPRQAAALAGSGVNDTIKDDVQSSSAYSLTQLLGTTATDTQPPILIRSDDGIEKRYLLHCTRCKLTLGYQLDWEQCGYQSEGSGASRSGRREDVMYLLEGAVVTTEEMKTEHG